jgi:hypothetical protein
MVVEKGVFYDNALMTTAPMREYCLSRLHNQLKENTFLLVLDSEGFFHKFAKQSLLSTMKMKMKLKMKMKKQDRLPLKWRAHACDEIRILKYDFWLKCDITSVNLVCSIILAEFGLSMRLKIE